MEIERGRFFILCVKIRKRLILCIQELAIAMKLNVFVVTDGAMGVINTDNNEIETLLNEYVKNRNISKKSVDKIVKRC